MKNTEKNHTRTGGLTAGLPYYVINAGGGGADTFQLSTTPIGGAVNLTNATAGQIAGGVTLSAGNNLGTTGILNGNAATLAIGGGGVVTLPSTTSGNLFVTAGAGAIAIDAPITDNGAGVLSLVKSGNAALRLSGANTFSGDITINAGTLTFSSLAAGMDGTGKNITFGGTATLDTGVNGWDGGQLTVASGALGTIAGRTVDFVSTTGSGAIVHASGNAVLNLGDATAFTGSITKFAGGGGGAVQFSALSDASGAGNLIFAGGTGDSNQRVSMIYNGSSALTFDTRSIEFQPKPSNWSFRNAILENNSANAAHTWTINTDLVNQNDRKHEFTLSGSNTGDNVFAGVIGDSTRGTFYNSPNPLLNGPELNLYKTGTGKWIVSGDNTFTGRVLVNQGTLSVDNITNSGVSGALGMGSLIQLGGDERYLNNNSLLSQNNSGTLEYTGNGGSSDRVFEIGGVSVLNGTGGGTIANNGSGALTFTAATFNNTIAGITATRTLTLGGANTGNNEIEGVIQDNNATTGRLAVTKADAGTWVLGGDNTYTGATNISNGTLIINGNSSTAVGAVTVAAAGTIGGIGTVGGNTALNGTLSPGESPGILTFGGDLAVNNGATYLFEAGDLTVVNGELALNSSWTLALGSGFQDGGSVVIFNFGTIAGSPHLTPTFTDFDLGFTPTGGLGSLTLSQIGNTIVLNGVSVIPEPSSALLGGLGMLLLLRRRR